jgi:hypothetical protein
LRCIHSKILRLFTEKVGAVAAEMEYQVFVNRLWISAAGLTTFICSGFAVELKSWIFGGVAIGSYVLMIALGVRMFVLRHRYFEAASVALDFRVSFRHPVRGLPNWRRALSAEQMTRLDKQYVD